MCTFCSLGEATSSTDNGFVDFMPVVFTAIVKSEYLPEARRLS